jgi:hypothetical protein
MLRTSTFSDRPGHPRAQRADAAHHELDPHPGPAGLVEGVDRLLVDDAVGLDPHPRRPAARAARLARIRSMSPARTPCGATMRVR